MTSIAVAYNKMGISIASDSAATTQYWHNNWYKIFNANKIFRLSNGTVGIWIYQSANLWNVPREVIIDAYRKQNKSFPTLKEYVYDFIHYIEESKYIENTNIEQVIITYLALLRKEWNNFLEKKKSNEKKAITQVAIDKFLEDFFDNELMPIIDKVEGNGILPKSVSKRTINSTETETKIIDWDNEDVKVLLKQVIERYKANAFLTHFDIVFRGFVAYLNHTDALDNYSGLVFIWYWDDEYFPQSFHIRTKLKYNNKLFLSLLKDEETIKRNYSWAEGYADAKVIQSSVLWYSDDLKQAVMNETEIIIKKICKEMKNSYNIDVDDSKISFVNKSMEKVFGNYSQTAIGSFFGAITFLSLVELWEVVETLVNMTSFKKKVSQDIETVGWKTDVAVISKWDGFVRLKKKNYIKNEYNSHLKN